MPTPSPCQEGAPRLLHLARYREDEPDTQPAPRAIIHAEPLIVHATRTEYPAGRLASVARDGKVHLADSPKSRPQSLE